jgi:hypothetical protein
VIHFARLLTVGVYLLWLAYLHWPATNLFAPSISFGSFLVSIELFIWAAAIASLARFIAISAMTLVARRRPIGNSGGWTESARGAGRTLISAKQSAEDLNKLDDSR